VFRTEKSQFGTEKIHSLELRKVSLELRNVSLELRKVSLPAGSQLPTVLLPLPQHRAHDGDEGGPLARRTDSARHR
jgi:hypothetical protein